MNKTKIEWTDYTWNPVVGCKNGCSYCYAKRMNDRFKWIPKWEEPQFYFERLKEAYKLKKPSKIFVGSMADLFGDWVNVDWIKLVLEVAEDNPRHTFQFLTKNPKRYLEFEFPENCWLGTTLTGEYSQGFIESCRLVNLENTGRMKGIFTFISIEPLLGNLKKWGDDDKFDNIDLVIVGAMTGQGAIKPKKEWIESIKHQNIFYKDNIKKFLTKKTTLK